MSESDIRPLRAKRSLGQNFLVDGNYVRKIVAAIKPLAGELVVEIGPGRGALTEGLLESGAAVLAIELDRELVPELHSRFTPTDRFRVVEADATEVDLSDLIDSHFPGTVRAKIVANLPYYISTAILQHLAAERHCLSELVLMFQREVVDRITAPAANSDRGFLTVMVEGAFEVERLFDVPPEAFRPRPKIWSSVVRLVPKPESLADEPAFRGLISAAFAQKRKTIGNNLKSNFPDATSALAAAGIDAKRRAETLELAEWLRLYAELRSSAEQ
ncbi:MAG: ribosomal RNA small subunit methyltransferase A [Acidobacteria bacterium]|nr:ribosomal RNA small subunit methyltransferase A [Acidobacteriota bacterium]